MLSESDKTSSLVIQFAVVVAWAAVLTNVVLMALRAYSAISFSEPLFVVTSGAEEESALSIWKFIAGKTLYTDPHKIPFVASTYNWLYYYLYGGVTRFFITALSLDIAWLPTIGRLISLAITIIGIAALYWACRILMPSKSFSEKLLLPIAMFVFIGPLVGFWAISLNVELAATVCTVLAAICFYKFFNDRPELAIILTSIFGYLAWCFKQNHIFVAGTLILFLLLRKEWRLVVIVCVIFGAGWAVAVVGGSEAYVKMLFHKSVDTTLLVSRLIRNLSNFAIKATPLIALLAICLGYLATRRTWAEILREPNTMFSLCGLAVTLTLSLIMSAKHGASENYYFVVTIFMVFVSICLIPRFIKSQTEIRLSASILICGWVLNIIASGSVIAGVNGVLSVRHWHDRHVAEKACFKDLPGPLLPVSRSYLTMPWITPSEPRFNLYYTYLKDRKAGRWLEGGGIGQLIENGYFGTIILAKNSPKEFDDGKIEKYYSLTPSPCEGHAVYLRK